MEQFSFRCTVRTEKRLNCESSQLEDFQRLHKGTQGLEKQESSISFRHFEGT
jgi:hypothetical protein